MIRIAAAAGLVFALAEGSPAASAQGKATFSFVAVPDGNDNGECTGARPCSPQGPVNACPTGAICNITVQHGTYLDPAVNIIYHRTISITGDCQDHAIGTVSCLALDSESTGTVGISGRQHIIAD